MTRLAAAFILALALAGSTIPAFAADRAVKLTLDGRPVDRAGGSRSCATASSMPTW